MPLEDLAGRRQPFHVVDGIALYPARAQNLLGHPATRTAVMFGNSVDLVKNIMFLSASALVFVYRHIFTLLLLVVVPLVPVVPASLRLPGLPGAASTPV